MNKFIGVLAATALATIFTTGCSSTPVGPNTATLGAAGSDLGSVTVTAPSYPWLRNSTASTGGSGGGSSAYWAGGSGAAGGSAAGGGAGGTGAAQ